MPILRALSCAGLLFVSAFAASAQNVVAEPPDSDLDKPAVLTLQQEFAGIPITVPMSVGLHATTLNEGLEMAVDMDGDLSALQTNAHHLVKKLDVLPHDNCKKYAQNVVLDVSSVDIYMDGDDVVAKVKGNADVWNCQKGAPSVTVGWKNKCWRVFGKKMCTKVPAGVKTHHGSDIKAKLIDADFTAIVPFRLAALENDVGFEVRPGKAKVIVPNTIVKFLDDIAGIFNTSAADILQKEISSAVDSGALRLALPESVQQYEPVVKVATFYKTPKDGVGVRVSFSARLNQKQVNELLAKLISSN